MSAWLFLCCLSAVLWLWLIFPRIVMSFKVFWAFKKKLWGMRKIYKYFILLSVLLIDARECP